MDTLPEDEEAVLSGQQARRPVAWLLLRPARSPGQQRQPQRAIALPIACDASLPDYIVKNDVFERGMKRHWHKHDRFRMFFASSHTNKTGGVTQAAPADSTRRCLAMQHNAMQLTAMQ